MELLQTKVPHHFVTGKQDTEAFQEAMLAAAQ
jgi:hypothetical protein